MDIESLYNENKINDYFYNHLRTSRILSTLPSDLKEHYINDAVEMSENNISNFEDQKKYLFIAMHAPEIIEKLTGSVRHVNQIVSDVYKYGKKNTIETFMDFYNAIVLMIEKAGIPLKENISKQAFPQGYAEGVVYPPYNISRWMKATEDIYLRVKSGENMTKAMKSEIKDWPNQEQFDYAAWLRFYQEGGNNKYKMAASSPSEFDFYLKPSEYGNLKAELPTALRSENIAAKEELERQEANDRAAKEEQDRNEARDRIESHRSKIISRLTSAEKMLSNMDGQFFAGNEQEIMLKLLQDLKRKVQTANKLSVKSSLFEDYIVRTGNYLNDSGLKKAAGFFYKIAQDPSPPDDLLAGLNPGAEGGESLDPPLNDVVQDVAAPVEEQITVSDELSETDKAFEIFEDLLNGGVADSTDDIMEANDGLKISFAQEMPPPQAPAPREEVEHVVEEPSDVRKDNLDEALDQVLENAGVEDAIKRLELISAQYKNRFLINELFLIDQILSKLGIASFFAELGECEQKVLESGNYVASRVETMLSRLRGTTYAEKANAMFDAELTDKPVSSPLQQKLQNDADEEKAKKERRKAQDEAKAESAALKQEQGSPIAEEAKGPVQLQQPTAPVPRPQ